MFKPISENNIGTCEIHPGCNPLTLREEIELLNEGQKVALKKVMCANDYVLMLGMPGTG